MEEYLPVESCVGGGWWWYLFVSLVSCLCDVKKLHMDRLTFYKSSNLLA